MAEAMEVPIADLVKVAGEMTKLAELLVALADARTETDTGRRLLKLKRAMAAFDALPADMKEGL